MVCHKGKCFYTQLIFLLFATLISAKGYFGAYISEVSENQVKIQCQSNFINDETGEELICNEIHIIPLVDLKIGYESRVNSDIDLIFWQCPNTKNRHFFKRTWDNPSSDAEMNNNLWYQLKSKDKFHNQELRKKLKKEKEGDEPINLRKITDSQTLKNKETRITDEDIYLKIELSRALKKKKPGSKGAVESLTINEIIEGKKLLDKIKNGK